MDWFVSGGWVNENSVVVLEIGFDEVFEMLGWDIYVIKDY